RVTVSTRLPTISLVKAEMGMGSRRSLRKKRTSSTTPPSATLPTARERHSTSGSSGTMTSSRIALGLITQLLRLSFHSCPFTLVRPCFKVLGDSHAAPHRWKEAKGNHCPRGHPGRRLLLAAGEGKPGGYRLP